MSDIKNKLSTEKLKQSLGFQERESKEHESKEKAVHSIDALLDKVSSTAEV